MSKQKSLAARLADLTSAAPSETFNPDQPDFDDGTGAGLSRYDDDDEEEAYDARDMSGNVPSASLRVAADMEMIGQEYHGKKVSRKKLEASLGAFGDVGDPEGFEGDGGSSDDDDDEVDNDEGTSGGKGKGKAASSSNIATSMNLDDISSDDDDDDDDDNDNMEEDQEGEENKGSRRGGGDGKGGAAARRSKQVRPLQEEAGGGGGGGGGGSAKRQRQSNVFAGVKGEDLDATLDEEIMKLNRQDKKARKSGRGVAGEAEMKLAKEVLRQKEWWDSMLEIRILLQRVMNAANQLPGPDELPLFLEGDASLTALAKEGSDAAQGLATQLSAVRRCHMSCWGISSSDKNNNNDNNNGGSDDGDEAASDSVTVAAAAKAAAARMVPDDDGHGHDDDDNDVDGGGGEATAEREHKACMGWWSDVFGRWHERTQLVNPSLQKKFKVVNQGPWAQVTASLANKQRSNRRSFMAVSETEGFLGRKLAKIRKQFSEGGGDGGSAAAAGGGSGVGEGKRGRDEEKEEKAAVAAEGLSRERRSKEAEPVDLEVIDDRDFYQHLLKEFMDSSGGSGSGYAASTGVPVRRKSRKKAVDRRASKGRKIKYVTHPKMQNFMFPQEYGPPPMEPSELFASLFGGAGQSR